MKISYILPTTKPDKCSDTVIKNIESFPEHDYEIMLVSPKESEPRDRVKHVFDDKCSGSLYAGNKGYNESDGDVAVVCVDDHLLPSNFLTILDYFETEEFKKKELKIANLCPWDGGPGKPMFFKERGVLEEGTCSFYEDEYLTGGVFPRNMTEARPYDIIAYPVLFRDSIEKHLDGKIWNERFSQCFADHWLGFYHEIVNKNTLKLGPTDIWMNPIPDFSGLNASGHHVNKENDRQTFLSLVRDASYNNGGYNR